MDTTFRRKPATSFDLVTYRSCLPRVHAHAETISPLLSDSDMNKGLPYGLSSLSILGYPITHSHTENWWLFGFDRGLDE